MLIYIILNYDNLQYASKFDLDITLRDTPTQMHIVCVYKNKTKKMLHFLIPNSINHYCGFESVPVT